MARPRKNNADWFSHDTDLRDNLKIKAVRAKYWLEGYAIFVMLLEVLADADNFILEENDFQVEMLAGDFRIDSAILAEMIDYIVNIWLLQRENWSLFSKHLIERMEALLNKRNNMRSVYQKKVPATETPVSEAEIIQKLEPKEEKMSEEDFEAFWKEYPIKEEKKKSREKFLKLPKELLPKIIQSIALNKTTNEKWLKGFIKQPTTWINGECWNDEIASVLPSKNSANGQQGKVSTDWHADLEV